MTPEQGKIYETVWSRFRKFLNLAPSSRDPKTALVERLRYKQKSTLLKVDEMVSFVAEQVTYGSQVFIACEFMETIDRYKEMLEAQRISVTEISGRVTGADREESRLRFQKGEAKVVLCTVPEGISLHAGETLPDGTKATSAPRITILHDIRDNNVTNDQILGRAHRDGQNSITYVPYLEDTVDMKVIDSYVNKRSNMNQMTGDDDAEAYERIFRQAALSSGK
jgi:helicase domain protein